jgi:hypothetical protein
MAVIQVNWIPNISATTTGQRVYQRLKSVGGAFSLVGFNPTNDLPNAASTTKLMSAIANKVYEFKHVNICNGTEFPQPTKEHIVFECVTPRTVTSNSTSITISQTLNLANVDINKIKVIVQGTGQVVETTSLITGVNNIVINGLTPSTSYNLDIYYGAIVNGVQYYYQVRTCYETYSTASTAGTSCDPILNLNAYQIPIGSIIVSGNALMASGYDITYQRLDVADTVHTLPNVPSLPYTITGLVVGQYEIKVKPTYATGITCNWDSVITAPCAAPTSFTATLNGNNIDIAVTPANFLWEVLKPNGITDAGSELTSLKVYALTVGLYGNYQVRVKKVCGAGFYSPWTAYQLINRVECAVYDFGLNNNNNNWSLDVVLCNGGNASYQGTSLDAPPTQICLQSIINIQNLSSGNVGACQ